MNSNKNKTVVIAMSGGVDSSVAAALLKKEGYNLIGITMKTWGYDDIPEKDSGCCSLETIYSAKNVAYNLGFEHYTLDFTEKFNEIVINNFISEYMKGNTPNPCVLCNKSIKWGALLEKAESLGADFIATGHYANVNFKPEFNRYIVSTATDKLKDQSYALWRVSQYALSKTLFPLGNFTKPKIREIAKEMGLKSAETPDSQEICFVPNDNYRELIEIRLPGINKELSGGELIYKNEKIGNHKGYPYYTIGQRKGLNVSVGKKIYVSEIDAENNRVIVADESELYKSKFSVREINLMMFEKLESPLKSSVKIRYNGIGYDANVEQTSAETAIVTFDKPQKAITPGQSAVFYIGENVLGGGIIDKVLNLN
ncbi:MAG TPA: tRNA 2-thiouridine(34) synthase MnmA [Ignavibacteria bacterium]|nr:tRNA 2-thiouridine(34) synthase MnmA [Ignavibacteria bacterium]